MGYGPIMHNATSGRSARSWHVKTLKTMGATLTAVLRGLLYISLLMLTYVSVSCETSYLLEYFASFNHIEINVWLDLRV